MRLLLFIILFPLTLKGQDLTKFGKVIFNYKVGHYNFGDTGYYERQEIIEFNPISRTKLERTYYLINKKYVANPATGQNNLSVNDTIQVESGKTFSFDIFKRLANNLNTSKDNFGKSNVFSHLPKIKSKDILAIARKNKIDKMLLDEQTGRVDKIYNQDIRKMKKYRLLDSFLLLRKPGLENIIVIYDAWNNLTITFMEKSDTIKYSFHFHNFLGQPFSKIVNSNYSDSKMFLNMDINAALAEILPKKSYIKKVSSIESVKDEYILWYLENIL